MVPAQDALIEGDMATYGEYLETVYRKMATYLPHDHANIIEVGCRPHDRGVISPRVIPHKTFLCVDKNPKRSPLALDVLLQGVYADVILSTCVLHHTPVEHVPLLLTRLHAPLLMFSGPNVRVLPALFGDHKWHINAEHLAGWLGRLGYDCVWQSIGLTEPLCEIFFVARNKDGGIEVP